MPPQSRSRRAARAPWRPIPGRQRRDSDRHHAGGRQHDLLRGVVGDGNGTIEVAELAAYVHAQVSALSAKVFRQRQVPQVRITSNYALAKPARVLAATASEIVIPGRPTHQLASASELLVMPALGARQVRKLGANTPVTLVNSEGGWTLVAKDGRPIGYVATRDIAPLQ
jgi:hypothetical protein